MRLGIKAICPNSKDHKTFYASAAITQTWLIEDDGTFVEVHAEHTGVAWRPDEDDEWICTECGATAIFEGESK